MRALTWNVDPVLLSVGPFSIHWYGLLFTGGILLASWLGLPLARRDGLPAEEQDTLLWWIVIGVVVGARLGHVLFYEPARYFGHPLEILAIWHGGLASHGGVLGLLVALVLFARRRGIPPLPLFDAAAVVAPLTGAAIRIGNFFNSEIIGRPSGLPWAVTFLRVDDVPRHPAQLYEALAYGVIGIGLLRAARLRQSRPGRLLGWSLVLVFSTRFLLEFLKEPQVAAEAGWLLDLGQLLSLPAIVAGVLLIVGSTETGAGKAKRERGSG
jgi:prolipoprotein diacylglyceryl transferase